MAILDFVNKPCFDSRYKLPAHLIQGVLITIVIGLSVPRLFMKNQPRTRAGTIALGMGAKSLIFLAYMLLTEHVQKLKRWHSYKANVILSCLEILFWGAVAFLVLQANLDRCEGITCTLSWIVVGVAVVVNISMNYTSAIAIREFREARKHRHAAHLSDTSSSSQWRHRSDEEEMVQHALPKEARTPSRQHQHSRPHRHHGGWTASERSAGERHAAPSRDSHRQQYPQRPRRGSQHREQAPYQTYQ